MTLVADEIVDFGIVKDLRQKGLEIISIAEDYQGVSDSEVIKIVLKINRY